MARPIVLWPDEVLDLPTQPVRDFGPDLQALLDEMLEAVIAAKGMGLAANQIGVPRRVALIGREDGTFFEIVNPELVEKGEPLELDEGCLSVPGEYHKVPRHRKVRVKYQDRSGAAQDVVAEGRLAHVFQHEIDHLDGRVYVRLLSSLKRDLIRQRMRKLRRGRERAT